MTQTKHTPGPWKPCFHLSLGGDDKCPCKYRGGIWGADGEAVVCEMGSTDCDLPLPRYSREVELANARVIAAAPRLLEALKYLLRHCKGMDRFEGNPINEAMADAARAIAEAEGRS